MELAVDGSRLLVDVGAADELDLGSEVPERQVLSRHRLGECDHRAVVGQLERRLVHAEHVLPDLVVLVHGPLGQGVELHVRLREGLLLVELSVVPGHQGHYEHIMGNSRRAYVDADLVAEFHDVGHFRDRVRVDILLVGRDPVLVAAECEEHTPKLALQCAECFLNGHHGVGSIARNYQDVVLELRAINAHHPLLVDLLVEVDVRAREDSERPPRPVRVHEEAGLVPCDCLLRYAAGELHQAAGLGTDRRRIRLIVVLG
mmetsp:Transcript_54766/g.154155  ORF Transcript_54766/g.154155 Transcript_54766/m.154155 type:complete len:259 (+) Transcript_54766:245-1021(+)